MKSKAGKKGSDVSPQNMQRMYETEYNHAANLLNQSLEAYAHTPSQYKKEAFRKVMSQALQVLKETASALKREEWMRESQMIEKAYLAYQAEATEENQQRLHHDLDRVLHAGIQRHKQSEKKKQ